MQLSYSDIMSLTTTENAALYEARLPHTGRSAYLYRTRLPIAVLISVLSGLVLIFSLFLPWLAFPNLPPTFTGYQIATSGAPLVIDNFNFPLLWLLPVIGLLLMVASALQFMRKIFSSETTRFIRWSFLAALVLELAYLFVSLFFSYQNIRSVAAKTGISIFVTTTPLYGFWICLGVTIVAGIVCLALYSNLAWCWELAVDEVTDAARRINYIPRPKAAGAPEIAH